MENSKADLGVIGAGSGGLSVAAAAAQMGLNVILIERHKMGGDCLNYGCVPSKSLLAAAKCADTMRHAEQFGITAIEPSVDYRKLHDHIRQVIAAIAPHDSVERFTALGVQVIIGTARFVAGDKVVVGDRLIQAKRWVIATGSRAAIPPIPGLTSTPYFTNQTIFDLTDKPAHLVVIGGGPIGCELAQAHALLGVKVTMLEGMHLLPKDDKSCVDKIRQRLRNDGIAIFEGVNITQVSGSNQAVTVVFDIDGQKQCVNGSHLLLATGRLPNIGDLNCDKAGIATDRQGVVVDGRLRTTNKRIYAIGDVARTFQFTHAAAYHAAIVIRNAIFHQPAKVDYKAMPWVTYTEPEIAHVGMNEMIATDSGFKYEVLTMGFDEVDRNQAERRTEGMIKALVTSRGRILGATIVGDAAGELILPWCLAIQNGLKISRLAQLIVPYPTRNEITKKVASRFFVTTLYSSKMRRLVRWLAKF